MINSKEIVFALSNILDMADPRLALHQQRVTYITWKIAIESKIEKQELENLIMAALLHDVGALSIQQKVDLIQGNERDVNKHTEIGQQLLNFVPWLQRSAIYIKNHHKKWNRYTEADNDIVLPSQILYLSDMLERLIDKDKPILGQVRHLTTTITNRVHDHFSPLVIELFLRASKREDFWLQLECKNFHLMLKGKIAFNGIVLNLNDILQISELIRNIIDFISPYTATHSAGVSEAAAIIAELLGCSMGTITGMKIAGNLHDIGKLTIPKNILEKEGRLNDYEYEIIKQHAYQTYNVLNKIKGLGDIANWASLHHERLNGTGYPFGYEADKLTNEVRMLAIADFFTSIIEDRPYRKGMDKNKAVALLHNQAKVGLLDEKIVIKVVDNFDYCYKAIKECQLTASVKYNNNEKAL